MITLVIKLSKGSAVSASDLKDLKKIEAGQLGKFFGCGVDSVKNILGLVLISFSVTILIIILLVTEFNEKIELIKTLSPIIALIIGYLAGKKMSEV